MTLDELDNNEAKNDPYSADPAYKCYGNNGIAYYYCGRETKPDMDTEWTGYEIETGNALMIMVGDDKRHAIDPEDIELIPANSFCRTCGQIGCHCNVYE